MSSNIRIVRVCQHCGTDFIAKTTTTQYCSHKCSRAAYKKRLKNGKIEASDKETLLIKVAAADKIKAKEFLTVSEVAVLLNCSRRTAYRLLSTGRIPSINLLERKTTVRRADIEKLFDRSVEDDVSLKKDELTVDVNTIPLEDCYTLKEICEKYRVSERVVHSVLQRNNIPRRKKGWYTYVSKAMVDKCFN